MSTKARIRRSDLARTSGGESDRYAGTKIRRDDIKLVALEEDMDGAIVIAEETSFDWSDQVERDMNLLWIWGVRGSIEFERCEQAALLYTLDTDGIRRFEGEVTWTRQFSWRPGVFGFSIGNGMRLASIALERDEIPAMIRQFAEDQQPVAEGFTASLFMDFIRWLASSGVEAFEVDLISPEGIFELS